MVTKTSKRKDTFTLHHALGRKLEHGVTLAKSASKLVKACRPRNIHISVRCRAEDKDFIWQMAKLAGVSLQKFVLQAAREHATVVLSLNKIKKSLKDQGIKDICGS